MVKKLFIVSSVLLGLVILATTAQDLAHTSAQPQQADTLAKNAQFNHAEATYLQIVAESPGTDDAFEAQENLTCLYVTSGKEPQAQAALEQLLAQFSGHEGIAAAVTHVADAYRDSEKHERACELYEYVIANWPNDEHALWSQMDIVISNACLGNESAADAAFEKLCTQYSGHDLLPKAVCFVADNYRKLEKHQIARDVYQCALANSPDAEVALWSHMGLAISNIWLGDEDAAQESVNTLFTDFAQDERLSIAACTVADEYRKSNRPSKASLLYEYVMDTWPDTEHALWSQMGVAISNIRLTEYNAARAAVDRLRADFSQDARMSVAACMIADEYWRVNKQHEACQLYQYVVDNWPDAEHALWSQMGLAISNLYRGDDDAAQSALDKLFLDFSKDERLPAAACFIADTYRKLKKHEQACGLYQHVLDNWPDAQHALWSQMGLAISNICLGHDDLARDAITRLLTQFSGHKGLTQAVQQITQQYRRFEKYEKAAQVWQYVHHVSSARSQGDGTLEDQVAVSVSNIALGSESDPNGAVDELIADFGVDPSLAEAIFRIGEQYYNDAFLYGSQGLEAEAKDLFSKAITAWERITHDLPASDTTVQAYYFSAACYCELDRYSEAIEYYQKIVDTWPHYEFAWNAQFEVGYRYEYLRNAGAVPVAEANARIKAAYEQVVQRYPYCPAARAAQSWLSNPVNCGCTDQGGQK